MRKSKQLPCPTEHEEQCAVIRWARMMARYKPELSLLHGDAGTQLNIQGSIKRRLAGRVKGWPDLFLPVRTWDKNGLFIELKRRVNSKVSLEQSIILKLLREQNFEAVVCRGSDEAIKAIKNYLGMDDEI